MDKRELIAGTINNLPVLVDTIDTVEDFVNNLTLAEYIFEKAKAHLAAVKARGMTVMQAGGIREITLNEESKIIIAQKKKECYDTAAIYKALAFTELQIAALPANPAWRKTAILAHPDTAGAWSQDIEDVLEIKKVNPQIIAAKRKVA